LLLTEPRWSGGRANFDPATDPTFTLPVRNAWAREVYKGTIIGSSSFLPASAEQALRDGTYDAIAFGRWFIANPDLVERFRKQQTLNIYDTSTFYLRDPTKGYVDYPIFVRKGSFPQIAADKAGGASNPNPDAGKSPVHAHGSNKPATSKL
jgi:2,4-dienoyl-CoA reductase-like NADH-dependent reductase (Old Yellow Enzyme family)